MFINTLANLVLHQLQFEVFVPNSRQVHFYLHPWHNKANFYCGLFLQKETDKILKKYLEGSKKMQQNYSFKYWYWL